MNKIVFLFLILLGNFPSYGQSNLKRPDYTVIAEGKIITREIVDSLGKLGYVKSMQKGVSEENRAELVKKFGDRIGDKEFIVLISLFTEEEKNERAKQKAENAGERRDTRNNNKPTLKINDSLRDFTVKMIDGRMIKISELKGKVTLINFWATWCAPCLMEFYEFPSKIIDPFKNSEFVLLPISRGETEEVVRNKMTQLKQKGIDFNVGIDPNQHIAGLYDALNAIPKNVLVDKNGIIRYISLGYGEDNLNNISSMIKKLLDE